MRAFGRLAERHHAAVAAVAFAITRDRASSDDIAQDTFIVAWTRLRDLRDAQRVRAWLCGIARNLSKHELRGRPREVADPDAIAAATVDPVQVQTLDDAEAEHHVRSALDELPESYREPLVLFYWEEQSIERVASALDISPHAAQKRISRARSMIGDELATRLDTTARARRPAKVAAASIVAVLASGGVRVSAAAGASKALPARALGGFGLAAVLSAIAIFVGLVVWHLVAPQPPAVLTPGTPPPLASAPVATPPSLPVADDLASPDPAPAMLKTTRGPRGGFGRPSAYEVALLPPRSVSVDLTGTYPRARFPPKMDTPPFTRHVRGRVVDANGKPLAGAAVIVAVYLSTGSGEHGTGVVFGDGGALTGADGTFDVAVHRDEPMQAIALHARAGWSRPAPVAGGRANVDVDLQVPRSGGLSGVVRSNGSPIEADVSIHFQDSMLDIAVATDEQGRFELPLLPPGTYRVIAQTAARRSGGTGTEGKQEVTVGSDRPASVVVDIPSGALVVANVASIAHVRFYAVTLLVGDHRSAVKVGTQPRVTPTHAVTGAAMQEPTQVHDVPPGTYTLCVQRFLEDGGVLPLVCKLVQVRVGDAVVETTFDSE
ncbi:MAG: sigma-70 family RNA polymerase sigma factor [Deltaproteobacteria bacterium]|nr:sigma-70 family RNA polymerase sigma factor [Deltaproteobacteria bacterium]